MARLDAQVCAHHGAGQSACMVCFSVDGASRGQVGSSRLPAQLLPWRGAWWRETLRLRLRASVRPCAPQARQTSEMDAFAEEGRSGPACVQLHLRKKGFRRMIGACSLKLRLAVGMRVLRRYRMRRPAPGCFMYQAAEEAEVGFHAEFPDA